MSPVALGKPCAASANDPTINPKAIADKLKECNRYEDLLKVRFVKPEAAAFAFADEPGSIYLRAALVEPSLQIDPSLAYADLLAKRPEFADDINVFQYLVALKHFGATAWMPRFLDSEIPSRRIEGCRAAKQLAAKPMRARVERLAAQDAFAEQFQEHDRKTLIYPVRQACQAALTSLE